MRKFEAEAEIARSTGEVWTYAADILRHPEWMAVSDARVFEGDGSQVGARGVERQEVGPLRVAIAFEVTDADPGRRLTWHSTDTRFDFDVTLDLEPVGQAACRARYTATIETHGVWRLLGPFIALEGDSGVRKELARLKERVEGAADPVVVAAP